MYGMFGSLALLIVAELVLRSAAFSMRQRCVRAATCAGLTRQRLFGDHGSSGALQWAVAVRSGAACAQRKASQFCSSADAALQCMLLCCKQQGGRVHVAVIDGFGDMRRQKPQGA